MKRAATAQETVKQLGAMVRRDCTDPRIRARVLHLFAGLPSMDHDAEIAAVWRFILDNVRYMHDPVVGEQLTTPTELDHLIDWGIAAEDCESLAAYAACLFSAAGLPAMFEIQGRDPRRPRAFQHCSLRVQNPITKVWWSFDLVGAQSRGEERFTLGDTLHIEGNPLELWTIDGERSDMRQASLMGVAFADSGSALGDTEATVVGVIDSVSKQAGQYGPYGALVGGIAQLGLGIYSVATGKQIGVANPGGPVKVVQPPPAIRAPAYYPTTSPQQQYNAAAGAGKITGTQAAVGLGLGALLLKAVL